MRELGIGCHDCAPKAWRHTPKVSGDYDLDETIHHRNNSDLPHRLNLYVKRSQNAYGAKTGYDGYHGYSGDD
jgi:D-alanyl-D-alanine carboxypeptidase